MGTLTKIITFSEFPFLNRLLQCEFTPPLTYSDILLKLTNNLLHEAKKVIRGNYQGHYVNEA